MTNATAKNWFFFAPRESMSFFPQGVLRPDSAEEHFTAGLAAALCFVRSRGGWPKFEAKIPAILLDVGLWVRVVE